MAKLLYFATLADCLGRTAEETELPPGVTDVRSLLAWRRLGSAAGSRGEALSETAALAPTVTSFIPAACAHCRKRVRLGHWALLLADNAVRVTVNRQFANLDTPLDNRHEIAILSAGRR